jgi:hypothetical protein
MRYRFYYAIVLFVGEMLAGCAGHSASTLLPSTSAPSLLAPMAAPPKCKDEKVNSKFGSVRVTLSTKGGSFCIPAFGGLGGDILYPSANPSVKVKLISSTTNYNRALPSLGSGTPVFYLQLSLSGFTMFGTNVPAGGGLAGKKLIPGKTYTALGVAVAGTLVVKFKSCYADAAKSNYGGTISGLGTLLKGVSIPGVRGGGAKGVVEIYSGKQTSAKC